MANSLTLTAIKNPNGTHTVSWNAVFDGKPWSLTISIVYGKKLMASSSVVAIESWSATQNPTIAPPLTGSKTFDPKAWGSSTFVTYIGYVATSENQTGQDAIEAQAPRITINM